MIYKSIDLENFRSYQKRHFDFHERVNIFVGENARGKTNLLESIYLTSYGKSFRTYKDKELINFDSDFCKVKGSFVRENDPDEINEIEITIDNKGKRTGNVNGIEFKKYSDIFDNVLAVIFSPEDLKIVKEDPEKRRDFLDREISLLSLSYYRNLVSYRKVLAQRNTYLKEEKINKDMLNVWDETLVDYGSRLIIQRCCFIRKLNDICKKIHDNIAGGKEAISIMYDCNILKNEDQDDLIKNSGNNIDNDELEKVKTIFREVIELNLENDLSKRYTTCGPQKDDLEIYINGKSARSFGSQGQQRTAALSMKLSEIELIKEEKGEYPILLLDDVLSELDLSRQNYLINSFEKVQLFITTTEISSEIMDNLPKGKIIEI